MKRRDLLAGLAAAPAIFAHPGHGETEGFSIIHYFTEPVHATVTLLAIGAALVFFYRRSKQRAGK